jgi:hypothetical protein
VIVSVCRKFNNDRLVNHHSSSDQASLARRARLPARPVITNINKQRDLAAPSDEMPFVDTGTVFQTVQGIDYGNYGSDPRAGTARGAGDIGFTATSRERFEGTAKVTKKLPGYQGFVPSNARKGEEAREQAKAEHPRATTHDAMPALNAGISVPGYKGHIPSSAVNQSARTRVADPRTTSAMLGNW